MWPSNGGGLRTGEVAERAGVTIQTLRYCKPSAAGWRNWWPPAATA